MLLVGGGVLAGALGGLLGIGGGVVLMPLLRFVVGLPPALAAGTCVLAVFFTTAGGSYRHWRLGHVRLRELWPIIIAGALTTALCSWAFQWLATRQQWLDLGMAVVFSLLALRLVRDGMAELRRRSDGGSESSDVDRGLAGRWSHKVAIGSAAGVLPGLLGIGTGAVLVPAFTLLLGASIKVAMGSSLACFACNALISASFKAAQGFVEWNVAIPVCVGTLVGSNLGALLNKRVAPSLVRVLFGLFFCYVAFRFVLSYITVAT